ncbi:MarR family winged helix-turn-helix transcriptional regulator [uncultured Limosilactobacillus sp.]|uniref:MarR family winged helix-turn-helix transcriptional regulator n=1 Tax=uncultured Limosilactobacillus sp. TaxID=2837629 RepID=UPI0025DF3296|nr:MarR family transcriptional regulator [uncultured Limosilactobacillus sp.]
MDEKQVLFRQLMKNNRVIHELAFRNHKHSGQFQGGGQIIAILGQYNNQFYQNELAKQVHVRPSSLSQVLNRLEQEKLIVRQRDQQDRRQILVRLTSKGQVKSTELQAEREEFVNALLKKLTIHDCEELVRIGELMIKGLKDHYQRDGEA